MPHRPEDEMRHPEEDIAAALRALPPAPAAWVEAAKELPRLGRTLDDLAALAQADSAFREAVLADAEAALRALGHEPDRRLAAALRVRIVTE